MPPVIARSHAPRPSVARQSEGGTKQSRSLSTPGLLRVARNDNRGNARWFFRILTTVVVLAACSYALAAPAFAQVNTGIDFGTATGLSTQDIRVTIAKIIRAVLGLLGLVALVIVIYGGFLWMTAGGNEDRVGDAKKWLTNGAIGLTIILLSFSITQFVISRLNQALYGSGTVRTTGGFDENNFLSGALGAGPIESHFPTRGAQDVARNTRIFITFRDPIFPASIAANTNGNATIGTTGADVTVFDNYQDLALPEAIQVAPVGVNIDPTKLTPAAKIADAAGFAAEEAKLVPVGFAVSADGRTIVLSPVVVGTDRKVAVVDGYARRALLGNAQTNTAYLVRITSAVKKAATRTDGAHDDVFTGAFREGYAWDFTVSTTIDLTPPKVTSVVPFPDAGRDTTTAVVGTADQPRNVLVQVNFNEAMDPTVTTGTLTRAEVDNNVATNADSGTGFKHLAVQNQAAMLKRLAGTFAISNQYRTVEFTTDEKCGQNSCGGMVYCLPGNAELKSWVEAATLEAGGPSGLPFSGVMDAAGNSLDGNGNGRAEGPGVPRYDRTLDSPTGSDSVQWKFFTTNTIDLSAPVIDEIVHYNKQDQRVLYGSGAGHTASVAVVDKISLTKPLEILFSKLMSGNVTAGLRVSEESGCNVTTGVGCLWSSAFAAHEPVAPATTPPPPLTKTRVTVDHASFRDAQPGFDLTPPKYKVRVDSSVKDIFQNCFYSVDAPVGPQGPTGGRSCATQNCS